MDGDEKLSGFLDQELSAEERAKMELAIKNDQLLGGQIARMHATDGVIRDAFDAPMKEAVPDRFTKLIDAALGGVAPSADAVVAFEPAPAAPANDNQSSRWWMNGAVAAGVAVALLVGTQFMAPRTGDGNAAITVALGNALEATPSLQSVKLQSGESVTPQLTFAKVGGGYCRQFSLSAGKANKSGVACKSDGDWSVAALVPASGGASADQGYVTAEGPGGAEIEAVMGKLRAGDPLDKAAEDALIARGWK